ncbi:MAG: tetratricopeptide repeat protein [Myxococcota bacterium]
MARNTVGLLFVTAAFASNAVDNRGARADFLAARALVTNGNYEQGISKLQAYLSEHPQGKYSSRARFFLGKAHVGANDFAAARTAWQHTIRDYPSSLEAHKAMYKLAWLTFIDGDPVRARAEFHEIASRPNGPLAPEAAAFVRYLDKHAP